MVLVMRIFEKNELSRAQLLTLCSEASILRQLHHHNVVQIISEHDTDNSLCQVFQLSVVRLSVVLVTYCNGLGYVHMDTSASPAFKKHEFACISVAAVHTDTSSVRVRVTCEFHSYEQFLCRSCLQTSGKNGKLCPD